MNESPANYFRRYRESLGFTNQNDAKSFLSGKDVQVGVDYEYIDNLNQRLKEISLKVSSIENNVINIEDIDDFVKKHILNPYETIKKSGLLPRLNN